MYSIMIQWYTAPHYMHLIWNINIWKIPMWWCCHFRDLWLVKVKVTIIFSSISWHIFQLFNNGAHINCVIIFRPGRFPRIAGNSRNHGKDQKFHKSDQILNQTKRNINKLCLGKISLQKTLRIKFSVDSGFSNELYGKNKKHGNHGNQQKAF